MRTRRGTRAQVRAIRDGREKRISVYDVLVGGPRADWFPSLPVPFCTSVLVSLCLS